MCVDVCCCVLSGVDVRCGVSMWVVVRDCVLLCVVVY